MERREFITFLAGLGFVMQGANLVWSNDESPGLIQPEAVGSLTAPQKTQLWTLFQGIDHQWQLGGACTLDRAAFARLLDLKTNAAPSYLSVYRKAAQQVQGRSAAQGVQDLWQTDHVLLNKYVLGEFIQLQLAFGAFRAFGLKNAAGHLGGSFSLPETPYRTAGKL